MRTARTVALTHEGGEVLVSGRKVPILEQLQAFRALRCSPSHPEFSEVSYQESDGPEHLIRLRTPDAQAEHDATQAEHEAIRKAKEEADKLPKNHPKKDEAETVPTQPETKSKSKSK